ncbi:unnamed protein product [Diamesa tonsa]
MTFQVLTLLLVIVYFCTTQGFNESVVQYNELPDNIVNGTVIENILLIVKTESPLNYVSRQTNMPKISDSEKGISKQCQKDSQQFIETLKKLELWALKMHDSSAKISSGILNGNINQLGDFDQCLNVLNPDEEFQGKYCLAYLQPSVSDNSTYLKYLFNLVQSYEVIKSNFDDPGHRIARFSTINWALCIPSTCSNYDVEMTLKEYVTRLSNDTGVSFKVQVNEDMCQVKDYDWIENLDQNTLIAVCFFLAVLLISGLSSMYDFTKGEKEKNSWLTSFSLIKNTKQLLSWERVPGDIPTAHAVRCFNAVMLIFAHKSVAMLFNPYINRTEMAEAVSQPWSIIGRAASLYTDPFLMLSGMLTTYTFIGRLQKGRKINFLEEYAGRYLRIMPPLAALILFCTYILPLLSSGPQWPLVITHQAVLCKEYWWRNLLFIHNWFGFKDMCLTHTHHVGIDTELFVVAPFFISLMWKWPKKGLFVVVTLAIFSTVARYYVTFTNGLTNYVYFGVSVSKLFESADKMYILPPHRFTVYAIGMLLGYTLRKTKTLSFSKLQMRFAFFVTLVLFTASFIVPFPMGAIDYKFNPLHAALFAAFAPIGVVIFPATVILLAQKGYEKHVTDVLSWRGFMVASRLSYSVYLTQFPIYFYNIGSVRNATHFGFFSVLLTGEAFWIIGISIVLTLFIELPFCNIKKNIFRREKPSKSIQA